MQEKWHKLSQAKMSMLKFRLPYCSGEDSTFKYLSGEIILQIWATLTSTETRLIVARGAKSIEYDCLDYESRMFRLNNITRMWQYFPHDVSVDKKIGLDHCFDCRAEIYTLAKYIKLIEPEIDESELSLRVGQMVAEISNYITPGKSLCISPHGVYPDLSMKEKYVYLRKEYYNTYLNRRKKIDKIKGVRV